MEGTPLIPTKLKGKIAVVTGGSRGIGKGIALGLGEAGVTVYVTGRTLQEGTGAWPGTITKTAEEVTKLGGHGIAVHCDHRSDAEVDALFRQVREEQGRLDILVNNATSLIYPWPPEGQFWEQPIALWDEIHIVGLRSHYVASAFAAPIMIAQRSGLIVNISSAGATRYVYNVAYGVGKAGVDKLAADMAHELQPHNVSAISLWPGLTKTENVMAHPEQYDLSRAVSPQFNGRVVAALAADPIVMEKTGRSLRVADLAKEYGFIDNEAAGKSSSD